MLLSNLYNLYKSHNMLIKKYRTFQLRLLQKASELNITLQATRHYVYVWFSTVYMVQSIHVFLAVLKI